MPRDDSPCAAATHRLWRTGLFAVFSAAVLPIFMVATPVFSSVLVIGNDRGGGVIERVQRVRDIRAAGTRIEIRGEYCLSACTMYLGLENTCVTPETVFGFHGPSSPYYGISLDPATFERWSLVMADHYPEPIRGWFLEQGRHRIVGFHRYSGADLINLGVARCTGV